MSFKCSECKKIFWMSPIRLVTARKAIIVRSDDQRPHEKRPLTFEQLRNETRNRAGEETIEVVGAEAEFCPDCAVRREPDNREVQRRMMHEAKRIAFEREEQLRAQLAAVRAAASDEVSNNA